MKTNQFFVLFYFIDCFWHPDKREKIKKLEILLLLNLNTKRTILFFSAPKTYILINELDFTCAYLDLL